MSKYICPERKYYVPVMNGERQLYLSSVGYNKAIANAVNSEGKDWKELKKQGWTIESFWGSEYE